MVEAGATMQDEEGELARPALCNVQAAPDPPAQRPTPFGEPRRPWWRRAGSGLIATLILLGAKLKTVLLLLPKLKLLTT